LSLLVVPVLYVVIKSLEQQFLGDKPDLMPPSAPPGGETADGQQLQLAFAGEGAAHSVAATPSNLYQPGIDAEQPAPSEFNPHNSHDSHKNGHDGQNQMPDETSETREDVTHG
jgi:hypothetical protein